MSEKVNFAQTVRDAIQEIAKPSHSVNYKDILFLRNDLYKYRQSQFRQVVNSIIDKKYVLDAFYKLRLFEELNDISWAERGSTLISSSELFMKINENTRKLLDEADEFAKKSETLTEEQQQEYDDLKSEIGDSITEILGRGIPPPEIPQEKKVLEQKMEDVKSQVPSDVSIETTESTQQLRQQLKDIKLPPPPPNAGEVNNVSYQALKPQAVEAVAEAPALSGAIEAPAVSGGISLPQVGAIAGIGLLTALGANLITDIIEKQYEKPQPVQNVFNVRATSTIKKEKHIPVQNESEAQQSAPFPQIRSQPQMRVGHKKHLRALASIRQ